MDPCDWTPAVARKHDFWCVLEPRIVLFRGLWQLCCKKLSLQQAALLTCLCFVCGSLVRRFLLLALLLSFLPFFLPSFFFSTAFTSSILALLLRPGDLWCPGRTCGLVHGHPTVCAEIPKKAIQDQETSGTSQATYVPARPPGHRPPVRASASPPAHRLAMVGRLSEIRGP